MISRYFDGAAAIIRWNSRQYRELITRAHRVEEPPAPSSSNGVPEPERPTEEPAPKNGTAKILKRLETVPDIKRDTSGITTQYVATGIVNMGAFAGGLCVAWASTVLPLLTLTQNNVQLTRASLEVHNSTTHSKLMLIDSEASWATSLLCLGAFFGSVPAGLISEYFGRKKTLLYLALPLVVSWILVASSPNVYGLYVGRFVGGVAVGAFSVAIPAYVADIAEKQLLDSLATFYHVLFSCGVLFGYIIGMIPNMTWLYLLSGCWPVLFFVAFIFLPESPTYLMSQGKSSEAKAALRYFRGIDNDIDSELKDIKESIRNYAKTKMSFKDLFTNMATIKALFVSFGLMIFQQLSGIFPILFFAETIFRTFTKSFSTSGATIILGFFFVSSTYFSTMLLKRIKRRILLILSFLVMAVSIGVLAIYYHLKASNLSSASTWVVLLTLCVYVSFHAAGAGPIPWLMLRVIFPPNGTRRATAITVGFHWFLAFGVTKLYHYLVNAIQEGWTLWHYAVVSLIGVIFVYFFVPETKGRTLQDIQNDFKGIPIKKKHQHIIEFKSIADV